MLVANPQMSMPPKLRNAVLHRFSAICCLLVALQPIAAQPNSAPESQELLNGLKVLFWPKPGSPDVLVKLRVHSGSAFDLAGKSGEMALLGDILFPDPETADFFTEQMGGKLNVTVNYDSVTITMVGKADQLNFYNYFTGSPDYARQDAARYDKVTLADVKRVAGSYLGKPRVTLTVVPEGKRDLMVTGVVQ